MRYKTEKEIFAVVESFENTTISETDWKHAEHLTVALYYIYHYDIAAAHKKMRDGIFNLLKSFGVDLTKETPYHETITTFWMETIDNFRRSKNGDSIVAIRNEIVEKFDKDFPLKFYSRELLFSDKARAEFVEPDLQKF